MPNRLPRAFRAFVEQVENASRMVLVGEAPPLTRAETAAILNGQAASKLRELVDLDVRRRQGAFFSSKTLAAQALRAGTGATPGPATILDPAVGAGDLLLARARRLPLSETLDRTLAAWSTALLGRDIDRDFVRLAHARLILLAWDRGARGSWTHPASELFPEITVGDGIKAIASLRPSLTLMNPPFTLTSESDRYPHGVGRVSMAAVFLSAIVEHQQPSGFAAILPDVIRTGSQYKKLRSAVEKRFEITTVEPHGQFDPWTDIDVFTLAGRPKVIDRHPGSASWWSVSKAPTLGESAEIRVGSVVPHRAIEDGAPRPFACAHSLNLGGEVSRDILSIRNFHGKAIEAPFIVLRRTSRPGDPMRGYPTIVKGRGEVMLENHLISIRPESGTLSDCRRIAAVLKHPSTANWLDERIRCRHLTVPAVAGIPDLTVC